MRTLQNYIGGRWVDQIDSGVITLVDPTTGTPRVKLPAGSEADIDAAVASAGGACRFWADLSLDERLTVLSRAADNLEDHIGELAVLEYQEMGKPVTVAEEFLAAGVGVLRSAIADARKYPFLEEIADENGIRTVTLHRPLGIIAQIIPWNFTVTATLLALGPLLAAGNCVVLKASEKAPLSAERMAQVIGLPPGVLNVVFGDVRAGAPLAAHPDVELVHFTGSIASGRSVALAAGGRLARTVLELGGKDPVIVDRDADPVSTARAVAYATFVNTGQICTSMERIYVHREIADEFVKALVDEARTYLSGDGAQPEVKIGPLVDERQRRIVQDHVDDAVSKGAKIQIGGSIPGGPGFFYPATVLTDVTSEMVIMQEETFGPVAPVQVVDSFEEALTLAADSEYGLAVTIYTHDLQHAKAATALPAGMVWINQWQGGGMVRMYEPAKASGSGATGSRAAFDGATRAVSVSFDFSTDPLN